MSKTSELKAITGGFSIDKPINYHHRNGDTESGGGSRLDFYAQTESAEEVFFADEDEKARRVFFKLFKKFLKHTYTNTERKFLLMTASGATNKELREVFDVRDLVSYAHAIQLKGYKNAETLRAAVRFSGWSKAEEFAETIFKRAELLQKGVNVVEYMPQSSEAIKRAQAKKLYWAAHADEINAKRNERRKNPDTNDWLKWRNAHPNYVSERRKKWLATHTEEEIAERKAKDAIIKKKWWKLHGEEINAKKRAKRAADRAEKQKNTPAPILLPSNTPEYKKLYNKLYNKLHRAEINAHYREYRKKNAEQVARTNREYRARKRMEKAAAKLRKNEGLAPVVLPEQSAPLSFVID